MNGPGCKGARRFSFVGRGKRLRRAVVETLESRQYLATNPFIAGSPAIYQGAQYTLDLNHTGDTPDSWTIDWGDGSIRTVEGNPTTLHHRYSQAPHISQISAVATVGGTDYPAQPVTLDQSFGTAGQATSGTGSPVKILTESNGDVLVLSTLVTSYSDDTGGDVYFNLQCYDPNGNTVSFGTSGSARTQIVDGPENNAGAVDMAIDSAGKIVVVGNDGNGGIVLARYDSAGQPDSSFGTDGVVDDGPLVDSDGSEADWATSVAIDSDPSHGGIYVAGTTYDQNDNTAILLEKYTSTGSLNTAFGGADWEVSTDAATYNGQIYTTDGTDGSEYFDEIDGGSAAGGEAIDAPNAPTQVAIGIQSDGSVVLAGADSTGLYVLRTDYNGIPDVGFSNVEGSLGTFYAMDNATADVARVNGNGTIFVTGTTSVDSTDMFYLARVLSDGELDSSLGGGAGWVATGCGLAVSGVAKQADGQYLAWGTPTDNSNELGLARFNADGSLDTTFNGGGVVEFDRGSDSFDAMALQSDSLIVVAGSNAIGQFVMDRFTAGAVSLDVKVDPYSIGGAAISWAGSVYTLNLNTIPGSPAPDGWSISWGDGQTSAVTGGASSISHDYNVGGEIGFTGISLVAITATATYGGTIFPAGPVYVGVAARGYIAPNMADFTVEENQSFEHVLARGTDSGETDNSVYQATIDWGDGSQPTVQSVSDDDDDNWLVDGSHTYFTSGTFMISVEVEFSDQSVQFYYVDALVTPPTPPSGSTNLSATATDQGDVALKWTDDNPAATEYDVSRSSDGVNFTFLASVAPDNNGSGAGFYLDESASPSTTYYYEVHSVGGDVGGNDSSTASATTDAPPSSNVPLPSAPTNLAATADNAASQIDLTWVEDDGSAASFVIDRSVDGTHFSQVGVADGDEREYADATTVTGTVYYYEVFAKNGAGLSGASNGSSAQVSASSPAMTQPALYVVSTGYRWAEIGWSAAYGAIGYNIMETVNGTSTQIDQVGSERTQYTAMNLSAGTVYHFQVVPFDINGAGPASNTVQVSATPSPLPTAPSDAGISLGTFADVTFADGARDETGFDVDLTWTMTTVDGTTTAGNEVNYVASNNELQDANSWSIEALRPTQFVDVPPSELQVTADIASYRDDGYYFRSDEVAPDAPTNLSVSYGNGSNTISWDAPVDAGAPTISPGQPKEVEGYLIERKAIYWGTSGLESDWQQIAVAPRNESGASQVTDDQLDPMATYIYRVRAYNAAAESAYVAQPQVSLLSLPAGPTSLWASGVSSSEIDLGWTNPTPASGETVYSEILQRSAIDTGPFVDLAMLTPSGGALPSSYQDMGLPTSSTWYYRLVYSTNHGASTPSDIGSATTFDANGNPPGSGGNGGDAPLPPPGYPGGPPSSGGGGGGGGSNDGNSGSNEEWYRVTSGQPTLGFGIVADNIVVNSNWIQARSPNEAIMEAVSGSVVEYADGPSVAHPFGDAYWHISGNLDGANQAAWLTRASLIVPYAYATGELLDVYDMFLSVAPAPEMEVAGMSGNQPTGQNLPVADFASPGAYLPLDDVQWYYAADGTPLGNPGAAPPAGGPPAGVNNETDQWLLPVTLPAVAGGGTYALTWDSDLAIYDSPGCANTLQSGATFNAANATKLYVDAPSFPSGAEPRINATFTGIGQGQQPQQLTALTVNVVNINGAHDVPGLGTYEYSADAGGTADNATFTAASGGTLQSLNSDGPDCDVTWNNNAAIGTVSLKLDNNYSWDFPVNVVQVQVSNPIILPPVDFIGGSPSSGGNVTDIHSGETYIRVSSRNVALPDATGMTFTAGVTIVGFGGRGVSKISVGFIQNVIGFQCIGNYANGQQLTSNTSAIIAAHGGSIVDSDNQDYPWYDKHTGLLFSSSPDAIVVRNGIDGDIFSNDRPDASIPIDYQQDGQLAPGDSPLVSTQIVDQFEMYVCAQSSDEPAVYANEANGKWSFVGDGTDAVVNNIVVWQPTLNAADPTQDAADNPPNPDTWMSPDGTIPTTSGPLANTLLGTPTFN